MSRRIGLSSSRAARSAGPAARLAAVAALALTLSGCLGYDGDLQTGYIMDDRLLDQVHNGASAEQVLVILGTPSTTSTVGGSAWYYISDLHTQNLAFQKPTVANRRIFAVYFDAKKKVDRIANYGLEDGKVVDFNNRTTPTGGGDTTFLKNMLSGLLRFQS